MSDLEKFEAANAESHIVSAEWTTNGKAPKGGPENWNFMRIKLKDKREFLLSREQVDAMRDKHEFSKRWEPRT